MSRTTGKSSAPNDGVPKARGFVAIRRSPLPGMPTRGASPPVLSEVGAVPDADGRDAVFGRPLGRGVDRVPADDLAEGLVAVDLRCRTRLVHHLGGRGGIDLPDVEHPTVEHRQPDGPVRAVAPQVGGDERLRDLLGRLVRRAVGGDDISRERFELLRGDASLAHGAPLSGVLK
jgi:hypothetical protein